MAEDSLYEVLGVSENASHEEIETRFRDLARRVHPDVGGTESLFRRVRGAYETLSDPKKRAAYDALRSAPVPTGEDDLVENSGWVRVDETPSSRPPPRPEDRRGPKPSESAQQPPSSAEPTTWLSPNLNSKPPALDFLWNRPWIVVLIAGFVITPVSRTFSTFGTLLFILGLIAGLGSRRAAHKYALRGAEQGRVDLMYGSSFEHYVGEVMRSSGYRVKHVGGTDHFGADLLAEREGVRSVVQTKCYVGSVGVQAIQEVVAAQAHYLANHAIAVTNSSFSSPAVRLACSNQVELWDRNKLADLARNLPRDTRVSPLSLFGSELAEGFSLSIHFFGAFLIGLVSVSSATGSGRRRRRRR